MLKKHTHKIHAAYILKEIILVISHTCNQSCSTKFITFIRWLTRASSCVLTDSRQYNLLPGVATNRCANSLWNISTAHLGQVTHNKTFSYSWFLPKERSVQKKFEDEWWRYLHTRNKVTHDLFSSPNSLQ